MIAKRLAAALVFAGLLAGPIARAAEAPAPDPMQGDGRVSSFYTWTGPIPDTPGRMVRREPLEPTLGLAQAGPQFRILYSSTDGIDGKTPVAVSGAFFAPKGTPPQAGWPLIAWAHGTTGVADICAPSWQARSYRDVRYLNTWLEQGYAVVATDYQGLGTPGPHPYLAVRPEAYSVLDSARAVLKAFPDVANRIVLVGQSQGGGAAFASAGIAPAYAPELGIRGTVATGVPYPSSRWLNPPRPSDPDRPDPTIAYLLYLGLFAQQITPALAPADLFSRRALPVFELARTTCIGPLTSDVLSAGLTRANAFAGVGAGFHAAMERMLPALMYTTLKLPEPVFIGTGQDDHDVPPASQLALVKESCAAGTVVEAHLYAGLNHSATVNASLKESLPFVRKVLAGEPITPVCEPAPE
ncbi:MAG TPA: lipase family protein [Acetobacteraceae bacterium]|nr:lipase family protein [Acetobacteraceae bacterium]